MRIICFTLTGNDEKNLKNVELTNINLSQNGTVKQHSETEDKKKSGSNF